jgi:hypothetical protein
MPSWTNCRTGQEGLANLPWLRRLPDSSKAELVCCFRDRKKKWVPQTIGTRQPREEGKAEAGNR